MEQYADCSSAEPVQCCISWHDRFSDSRSSREIVSVGIHRMPYSETICHNKIPIKNYQIIKYHIFYLRPTLCPQTIETTVTIQCTLRIDIGIRDTMSHSFGSIKR